MPEYDFDIGILGGGAAGLTVASGAAQLGAKAILIEKEKELGGDCLHFGCVPSKTLIRTANVFHLMKNATTFGLPDYDIRPVDFRKVAERIQSVIDIIQKSDSEERFCNLGVKVEFGSAAFIDEHSVRLKGRTISAKYWVIATGSSPSRPDIKGIDKTPCITNKEIFSLDRLPGSMIVLGGGPVGIEMAQAFNRLGTKVVVVQRGPQILSKEDRDMADLAMEILSNEGVKFHLNSTVISANDLGNEREIVIRKESETVSLKAETVLVATGREANLESLGLKGIAVEFGKKGLKLDSRLRTSQKHIFGAGDVTGDNQFTHAAAYEAGVVIANAIFHLPKKVDYRLLPWCTFTEPELASIGMNEKRAAEAGIEYSVWTEEFKDNDRSLIEGEKTGKLKMLLDKKERPIGIQILGLHAGELVSEWVAAMNDKISLSSLVSAVHPYPTLSEINKKVVGAFYAKKVFSDKMKKSLKFLFNLKGRAC